MFGRPHRCRSWRPLAGATLAGPGRPGGRDRCWTPCRALVGSKYERCAECTDALLSHPNPQVRLALVSDPSTPQGVLEVLAGDMDISVAVPAAAALKSKIGSR